ncbi:MAG: YkgJ family cysteine cluster protein [Desulfovibrionaceae bacterium]|nr:YkgJ family cysteine cluster protein [Desulfovibrionaceae bacterium]
MPKTKKTNLVIDFAGRDRLIVAVDAPLGRAKLADALPALFKVADAVFARTAAALAGMGRPVSCGPGCAACCRQLIVVSEPEALRLARLARDLPEPGRETVLSRFQDAASRLEQAGLLAGLIDAFSNQVHDWRRFKEVQKAYWDLGIDCPFLENGVCGVYRDRPLICRQYAVTSPPEHCARVFSAQAKVEKVIHPLDLAGALAGFDGAGPQRTRALPLTLALLLEGLLKDRPGPEIDGPNMIARFLDYASLGYAGGK